MLSSLMRSYKFLLVLLIFGCGQELIGDWGEPPPDDTVLIFSLGDHCYTQDFCTAKVFKNCENHCASIYIYSKENIADMIQAYDSGNYKRVQDCEGWHFCWEQADEGIWISDLGDYAIEERMSRYYQCPELMGTIEMFNCPYLQ